MRYQDFEMLKELHIHTADASYSLELIQDSIDRLEENLTYYSRNSEYYSGDDPTGSLADFDMQERIALMEDVELTIREELKIFDRYLVKTIAKREELRTLIGI